MKNRLTVHALWQPVKQYALHLAFFIVFGSLCEDEQRLIFRQVEVTLNISSELEHISPTL